MFAPTKPALPSLDQHQVSYVMKRKREDEAVTSPYLDVPEVKRRMAVAVEDVHSPALGNLGSEAPGQNAQDTSNPVVDSPLEPTVQENSMTLADQLGQGPSQTKSYAGVDANGGGCARYKKPVTQPRSTARVSREELHQIIEAQFSLEILLKHKELRLIDQEFAKCQAALEQLRRCQTIPFPAMSSDPEAMQMASSGSGSVYHDFGTHAPPWGVANGPYTRHYRRWLIQDPIFGDADASRIQEPPQYGKTLSTRAMRGSKTASVNTGIPARSQRGANTMGLAALPHGYPEHKEQKGPMIVKRKTDGKMVKLVCLDCRRSNFNSVQGFVNHCRIAHSRHFLDHQKAIEACGEEMEDGIDGEIGEVSNVSSQATASAGLVHPLIRSSGHLARITSSKNPTSAPPGPSIHKKFFIDSSSAKLSSSRFDSNPTTLTTPHPDQGLATTMTPQPSAPSEPFTPSPNTPHLSALFAKMGRGGDLNDMVKQAQTKPEIDLSAVSDDEEEDESVLPDTPHEPQSRSTRGILRGGHYPAQRRKSPMPLEQAPSRQPLPDNSQRPSQPFTIDVQHSYPFSYQSREENESPGISMPGQNNSPFNLSPNTTEAHTAPSLISDDGEYEGIHSDSESPESAEIDDEEDHYIHTEVMDQDDVDLAESSSAHHQIGLGGKPHQPVARRPSQMRTPMDLHNEEPERRHVAFSSPVRRPRLGSQHPDSK